MAAFWNNLKWPKIKECYVFITAVVNVCMYVQPVYVCTV